MDHLVRLGIEKSQVILFGFRVRGRGKGWSDIDVAAVSPTFEGLDVFERQLVLSEAHRRFGVPIEPVGLTPDDLAQRKMFSRFVKEGGVVGYNGSKNIRRVSG